MKVLVLSANMGSVKSNIMVKQEGIETDFICYNDSNFPTRSSSFTPRMTAKIPKMLGWMLNPGYDYYIWMDSTFSMSRPDSVAWFIENINSHDALFIKHPFRNSIMKEAEYIVSLKNKEGNIFKEKVKNEPVIEQAKLYCSDHTFKDNTLIIGGAFCYSSELVKNTEHNMMKEWYFQTCIGSVRDQISLPYVLHKFNVNCKLVDINYHNIKYLK